MRLLFRSITAIVLLILYVFLINFIASIIALPDITSPGSQYEVIGGSFQPVGVSASIDVTVVRNRWYGQIIEENGTSYLSLFGFIWLPLKIMGNSFVIYHGIFLVLLILFMFIFRKKTEQTDRQKERFINPFHLTKS